MHKSSLVKMQELLSRYVMYPDRLLDVGSQNVTGTYRHITKELGFKAHIGIDICEGDGVDIVVPEIGTWDFGELFPVVISGQCLEHVRMPWIWIQQLVQLVEPGGLVFIIAPWQWRVHKWPLDCWRILPDGMNALFDYAGLESIEVGIVDNDCFGVASKG